MSSISRETDIPIYASGLIDSATFPHTKFLIDIG